MPTYKKVKLGSGWHGEGKRHAYVRKVENYQQPAFYAVKVGGRTVQFFYGKEDAQKMAKEINK